MGVGGCRSRRSRPAPRRGRPAGARPAAASSAAVRGAWSALVSISSAPPGRSQAGASAATRRWTSRPSAPPSSATRGSWSRASGGIVAIASVGHVGRVDDEQVDAAAQAGRAAARRGRPRRRARAAGCGARSATAAGSRSAACTSTPGTAAARAAPTRAGAAAQVDDHRAGSGQRDRLRDEERGAPARHEHAGVDGDAQPAELGPAQQLLQRRARRPGARPGRRAPSGDSAAVAQQPRLVLGEHAARRAQPGDHGVGRGHLRSILPRSAANAVGVTVDRVARRAVAEPPPTAEPSGRRRGRRRVAAGPRRAAAAASWRLPWPYVPQHPHPAQLRAACDADARCTPPRCSTCARSAASTKPSQANAAAFDGPSPRSRTPRSTCSTSWSPPRRRRTARSRRRRRGPAPPPATPDCHPPASPRSSSSDDITVCEVGPSGRRGERAVDTHRAHRAGPRVRLATVSRMAAATSATPTCTATRSSSSRRTTCGPRRSAAAAPTGSRPTTCRWPRPRLSPDGTPVAWTSWRERAPEVFVTDGRRRRRAAAHLVGRRAPRAVGWTPDGRGAGRQRGAGRPSRRSRGRTPSRPTAAPRGGCRWARSPTSPSAPAARRCCSRPP